MDVGTPTSTAEWEELSEDPAEWQKIESVAAQGEEIVFAKVWPWIQQHADTLGIDLSNLTSSHILAEKRARDTDELAVYIHRGHFWQELKIHPSFVDLHITAHDVACLKTALFYEKEKEQSRIGMQNFINMWLRTNGKCD